MVRIGIVGAGAMGTEHAGCYAEMKGVEVAGVFSRDPAKAAAVAEPLGVRTVGAAADLIADPSIDAIDVCLPTPVHAPFVLEALAAGKHVMCETPLTLDAREGRRMVEAARQADRLLQVGLLMRSISACRTVKAWAQSGEHGDLISLTTHRLGSYLRGASSDHKSHYSDPTTELMTFDFDFVLWTMGRPDRVFAGATQWRGGVGEASATLVYGDGRSATVLASGVSPASYPFTTGFRAQFERARLDVETVIAGGDVRVMQRLYLDDSETEPNIVGANPYYVELERFIDCIEGRADPSLLDAERALEALELSLATQRSLDERVVVAL